MNIKEKSLLVEFIDIASDTMSCNGCNDVDEDMYTNWTVGEREKFVKEYHDWNKDSEGFDPKDLYIPDFALISFLGSKLIKQED